MFKPNQNWLNVELDIHHKQYLYLYNFRGFTSTKKKDTDWETFKACGLNKWQIQEHMKT